MTAIQRANSDLRLNPHFHTLFLDGTYGPDRVFQPAPVPCQEGIEQLVQCVGMRIVRFLHRGVITLVTSPGDGEITVVADETMGQTDPLLAKLLAAATAGIAPAGEDSSVTSCGLWAATCEEAAGDQLELCSPEIAWPLPLFCGSACCSPWPK